MTSENESDRFCIAVYDGKGFSWQDERLIREIPLALYLNDRKVITIACAGLYVEELAVGFLRSEGFLRTREDVAAVDVSPDRMQVRIATAAGREIPTPETETGRTLASSGARGFGRPMEELPAGPLSAATPLAPEAIIDLMERFLEKARLHEETGGTHAAALARNGEILAVREDIGRHNTIDMLGGYALLHGVDCRDAVILRTGRVSSEIVHKIRRLGVPLVCSLSVPTTEAVEIAQGAGMTLIGSIRRGRMKIYTHGKERVQM
jgi:FdhD protein